MRMHRWVLSLLASLSSLLAAESPAKFKVGDFEFQRPEKWIWIETDNQMRKAQLKVTAADGKTSGEVVFFHFGLSNGGGTKANVDRWLGQFQEKGPQLKSKVDEMTVRSRKITFVEAHGTYLSGTPGGPKTPMPDHTLLGAILESPEGSVFIRLTAPSSLGQTAQTDFRKLAESGIP